MSQISDFLEDIDRRWRATATGKIRLRIIGSAALMLQTGYARGTKDSDILETALLTAEIKDRLTKLAGPDSELHDRHRIYIDFVAPGLPFLPHVPLYHPLIALNRRLSNFEIEALDVVDTVVSKL